MPREIRKRGKKHKKAPPQEEEGNSKSISHPTPWIDPSESRLFDENNSDEFPFGLLDADFKAYLRAADAKILEWSVNKASVSREEFPQEAEEKQLFLSAVLSEMSGKELQLATDPDCSFMLERILHSMNDFTRRVFMDRLSGSFRKLAINRFGSHVCETCFDLASTTVSCEESGFLATLPSDAGEELPTMTQLINDIVEELLPSMRELSLDQFGSHVLCSLLILLRPQLAAVENSLSHTTINIRSKSSEQWKKKQGLLKSLFSKEPNTSTRYFREPSAFDTCAMNFLITIKSNFGGNEFRAMAANRISSLLLQLLIRLESDIADLNQGPTLASYLLPGLLCDGTVVDEPVKSDFIMTMLRDSTASRVAESLIATVPLPVFSGLWKTYFAGQLPRLIRHPIGNFVVIQCIKRLDSSLLNSLLEEMGGEWGKIVRVGRIGVALAVVDRSRELEDLQVKVIEAVQSGFDYDSDNAKSFVPSVIRLVSCKANVSLEVDVHEINVQGALLLQSILQMPRPHHDCVLKSIESFTTLELLTFAQHPISSRVLDAILYSPTVSYSSKRSVVLAFMNHYHVLVNDKIGSRIADRCWNFADLFLRTKIAQSMMPHELALLQSFYGKFFARTLNLPLLRRNPSDWKRIQQKPTTSCPSEEEKLSTERDPAEGKRQCKRKTRRGSDIEGEMLRKRQLKRPKTKET